MGRRQISLTRTLLEQTAAEIIGYGAKDTGEMGGGAAAAILAAAGTDLLDELERKLSDAPSLRIGDVVVTKSFGLDRRGTRWICHIISIIKHTPQGAWCPEPKRLAQGVRTALEQAAALQARSIAIAALGTGEGRVKPEEAASLMIGAASEFLQRRPEIELEAIFSLPTFRDYEAFQTVLGGDRRLI